MPVKIDPPVVYSDLGSVLTLGTGDTGQLGLGPDITERTKPCLVSYQRFKASGLKEEDTEKFVQICAGGMHTVCLCHDGKVYTFGCNDEGALGRLANLDPDREKKNSDTDETIPGRVDFPDKDVKIVMVSAGDSHTFCLDYKGQVWGWGTFRGASGPIGLVKPDEISKHPIQIPIPTQKKNPRPEDSIKIIKICSGQDHVAMLSEDGNLYTMGCAEQGQLGRVAERFSKDGGRSGMEHLLCPTICRIKGHMKFCDVWAGGFATFAKSATNNVIYACGLNNYGQLGLKTEQTSLGANKRRFFDDSENPPQKKAKINGNQNGEYDSSSATTSDAVRELEGDAEEKLILRQGPLIQFMLSQAKAFSEKSWRQISVGMHHVVALSDKDEIFTIGRTEYGRLGLGSEILKTQSIAQPRQVKVENESQGFKSVSVGESCSFAISKDSLRCYAWGMGSNLQLAQPTTDDNEDGSEDVTKPSLMVGKNMQDKHFIMIDAGGQHTVLLAKSSSDENVENLKASEKSANKENKKEPDNDKKDVPEEMDAKTSDDNLEGDQGSEKKISENSSNDSKKMEGSNDCHVFTEPVISGKKTRNNSKRKKKSSDDPQDCLSSKYIGIKSANSIPSENLECLSTSTSLINGRTFPENQSLPSPPGSTLDDSGSLAGNASETTTTNILNLIDKSCGYSAINNNNGYNIGTNYSTAATINSGPNSIDGSVLNFTGGCGLSSNQISVQGENDMDFESSTSGSQFMGPFDEDASCKCTDGGSSYRSSLGGTSAKSSLLLGGMAGSGLGLFSNILLLQSSSQNQSSPAGNNQSLMIHGPSIRSNDHRRDQSINRTRSQQRQYLRKKNRGNNPTPRSCRQMAQQFHSSQCHMSSVCSTNSESIGFPTTNTDSASFDSIDSQSL